MAGCQKMLVWIRWLHESVPEHAGLRQDREAGVVAADRHHDRLVDRALALALVQLGDLRGLAARGRPPDLGGHGARAGHVVGLELGLQVGQVAAMAAVFLAVGVVDVGVRALAGGVGVAEDRELAPRALEDLAGVLGLDHADRRHLAGGLARRARIERAPDDREIARLARGHGVRPHPPGDVLRGVRREVAQTDHRAAHVEAAGALEGELADHVARLDLAVVRDRRRDVRVVAAGDRLVAGRRELDRHPRAPEPVQRVAQFLGLLTSR